MKHGSRGLVSNDRGCQPYRISEDSMKNSQLSDDEFLAAFESGTLADFHHADHIRVAWIYLRRLPVPRASERMAESLRQFAARKGVHQKYHETITHAWMILVWDALERDRKTAACKAATAGWAANSSPAKARVNNAAYGFDAFAVGHPELLNTHALDKFYSARLLTSPAARTRFLPPDISPLPGNTHNPELDP
jgi:hypothetical protein